jgi:rhodanese-related sulfurtransferase
MTAHLFDKAIAHAEGFRDVEPTLLHAHLGDSPVVDVREPHEFTGELGHVPGARLTPLATVEAAARQWDPEKDVVIVCRSGGRSGQAARTLVRLGFKRVMNLRGGMLAYYAQNLPVER